MNYIKSAWLFLTRTSSNDPDKARNEYILLAILASMSMISILATIFLLFLKSIPIDTLIIFLSVDALLISGWLVSRHGRFMRLTRYIPLMLFFLSAVYGNYIGGMGAPAILLYVLAIIVTSLLFSRNVHIFILILSILSYFILALLHYKGILIAIRDDSSAFNNRVMIAITAIIGIGVLLRFLINQILEALKISRIREEELKKEMDERKQTEESLKVSEDKYRLIYENAVEGIFQTSPEGRIKSANPTLARILAYDSPEELITNITDLKQQLYVYPEQRDELLSSLVDQRAVVGYEVEFYRKDKQKIWVSLSVRTVRDDSGKLLLLEGFLSDISKRKSAETELKRAIEEQKNIEKVLRKSQEEIKSAHHRVDSTLKFTEAVLSAIPTPVFYKDREGRYIGVNDAFSELMGFTADYYKGKTVMELWPDEFAQVYHNKDLELMNNPEKQVYEYKVLDKNGVVHPVIWGKNVFRDENGYVAGIVGAFLDISELRHTEEALRDSEELYRVAIEGANDGVAILKDNVHVFVNHQFLTMFGYNNFDEISGLPPFFTVHPDDRELVASRASARERDEDILQKYDFKGIKKDRTIIYVEVSVNMITYKGEKAILVFFRDITERKQAEKALQESERQLKAIVDGSPMPQFVIGKDHRIIHWNKALEEYSGIRSEDVIGTNQHWRAFYSKERPCMADLIVDGEIDSISQWYTGKYNKSQLINNAYEATDFFNTIRGGTWLYFTAAPIYGDDGSVVGAVETLVDVTEQRIAEKSLGESEQKFRILFENAPFGMIMISNNGTFNYINHKSREIFGYELEEIPNGKTWFRKVFPDANLRHKVISEWKEDLEKYKIGEKRQRIYTAICKDGSSRIINFIPVMLATGDHLMACEDITERKLAEDEKDTLQAQLVQAQKMESVGRLAGGVAHDFNNMLGVILGYTELAEEEIEHIQPISSYLDEIRKAAQRSSDLTRQLLAFARKQAIVPKVLDLNETIDGMLKILRRLIGEDIDLVWMPEGNLWQVKIDPSQVDQLLANLCVNARDAIAGIGKITIETENITFDKDYCAVNRGFIPGEYVMLAVSDDGIGMEKYVLDHLFEPFFTTKDFGKGTGLGLATVYGIIKQNNGFIKIYSEPGKGSTFKIYISRFIGEAEKTVIVRQMDLAKGQGEILLLVEDDPAMLKVIGEMLEMLNYTVLSAGSPDEAINLAKNNIADIKLLITDVIMPTMNGRELEKVLSNIIPGLKCLFASGYTANVIAHHGVLNEGVNFIQKPFSKQALATKVREVLDSKK